MKIFILGGYGNTGKLIAELLLKETESNITIAGRSFEKAKELSDHLNSKYSMSKCAALKIDVNDQHLLVESIKGFSLVVVASSTTDHVKKVAEACLEAKVDYIDTQLSTKYKHEILAGLEERINQAGCCFITDAGFHPGVPGALVRYAARLFDTLEKGNVYSLIREDWGSYNFSESTIKEMIAEFFDYRPFIFRNGEWVTVSYQYTPVIDFGEGFGKKKCVPLFMEELKQLSDEMEGLKETGFFVTGFNWFFDNFAVPVILLTGKLTRRKIPAWLIRFFVFSIKRFNSAPYMTILKFVASGKSGGKEKIITITLSSSKSYVLTAVPIVACIKQLIYGDIRKEGLHFQALIVEPNQFFNDIHKMGVKLGL